MKLSVVVAASLVPLAIGASGNAHADEQSYLAALGPQLLPATSLLAIGRMACDKLHYEGATPESLPMSWGLIGWTTPQMVDAAQHELCPDTLGPAQ
jgi:Protein of unknown function (DUF732)